MQFITSIKRISLVLKKLKKQGKIIGFIPTMGCLHQGHLSLIRRARKETDMVVLSIFVNPIQFGPKEDYKKYPRTPKRDIRLAKSSGVDILFCPRREIMYPIDYLTYVNVEKITEGLCGKFRPGHFKGVTTAVAKLFNLIHPDIAYFGQKDSQQAVVIRKMVRDLNMPIKIKVMPTVREADGLAMSSRNSYLNSKQRKDALILFRALNMAKESIKKGQRDSELIIKAMTKIIKQKTDKIDYIQIVDSDKLNPAIKIKGRILIALAVWVGRTRLIDNIIVNPKQQPKVKTHA
jgi:pantoate--beta-alanine ligase